MSVKALFDLWDQASGKFKVPADAAYEKLDGIADKGAPRYADATIRCTRLHCGGFMRFELAKFAHECDRCGFLLVHPVSPAFAEQPYEQVSIRQPTNEEIAAMRKYCVESQQLQYPTTDNKITVSSPVRTQSVQTDKEIKVSMHKPPSEDDLMVSSRVSERFLEILGLKGQHVESLSIDFAHNELIKVHATMYVNRRQMQDMETALIAYNLVPDPELKDMLK